MRVLSCLLGLGLVLAALAAAPAAAQTLPRDDFSSNRFYVAPGAGNYVLVESPQVGADLMPTFGATLMYGHRPYAADDLDCVTGSTTDGCNDDDVTETDLVAGLGQLQLHGSFTFLERIQIGAVLPLIAFDGEGYEYIEDRGERDITARTAAVAGPGVGIGDPRISAKIRILDPDSAGNGVMLGASLFVTVPLGAYAHPQQFMGDRAPNVGGSALAAVRFDAFRLALNVGFTFREEQVNLRSAVGPEATWGLAAAYRPIPAFEAIVEATGATSFGQRFDSEAPTEVRAAALVHLGEFSIRAGGGAGIVYGIGVPVFSVFAGATFAPEAPRDTDGDGLMDDQDGCPDEPEDADGFADEDGCPELDNDGDEVLDADDACPNEPEDMDDFEDEDGCIDEDDDGDGIRDGYDSCPREAEDMDGDRDSDGCPDVDTDNDGIPDEDDQCVSEPEDFDGFGDEDGCPEEDFDEDGILDADDDCPEVAGPASRRGCAG
ncbi:MAG: thrombospondin type 3 repeat-containing protein [Sandaracinaceae bacterium]